LIIFLKYGAQEIRYILKLIDSLYKVVGILLLDHDLQLLLTFSGHDSKSPTTPHNTFWIPKWWTIIFSYDDSMHYTLTWSRDNLN